MKPLIFFLVVLFNPASLFGQPDAKSSGDNSPAIIAQNFSVTYGVRADAIEAILWIYEAEGYTLDRRKRATEQIIREYAQSPEKQQKTDVLSERTRRKLGIRDAPEIANALEWDLFARIYYLSTTGQNSPAVVAQGNVNIWYGIPPRGLRALAAQLEKNKTDLSNFETQLADQVKKYEELKTELETYGGKEEIYKQAEALLEEGRLEEAEKLIEADYHASKKRQAYKGYVFGKAKELLLKYGEAAEGYRDAVFMDSTNSTYQLYYANNESTLANYDEAIKHYETALGIDSLKSGNEERIAILINNLGVAWKAKVEYDKAIGYYEKALQMDIKAFGESHSGVTRDYNNLGAAWYSKGEYDKAVGYFEKALQIDVKAYGESHPKVTAVYNNLGAAWYSKGEYDKAIGYYEKALQINVKAYGESHPNVATDYSNLGSARREKGEYDKAIGYFEKALQIDVKTFGENHPNVATGYNNLGSAWREKGEYNRAIGYFEKALQIDVKAYGESHPKVTAVYNNLGLVWDSKGEYDKAIGYYEKALQIDVKALGENHQNVATDYNNLGEVWRKKGEYDKAIGYYEKALQIDVKALGENHPNVATRYNNLGSAWYSKGDYDKAIRYFEKCQKILDVFFEPDHTNQITTSQNMSYAANGRGMELYNEKKYQEALLYFQKALQNAEKADDDAFALTCLNNIGSMQKNLQAYAAALKTLDTGLEKAAAIAINAHVDKAIQEHFAPEMLADPEVQAKIAETRTLIRRMQYHKVGCLKGLKRDKEAEILARQLWQDSIKTNDTYTLEDLKKEGYHFGKK